MDRQSRALGQRGAQRRRVRRELQHECALQVAAAVKAGRQAEVALEQRARLPEQRQDLIGRHHVSRSFKTQDRLES